MIRLTKILDEVFKDDLTKETEDKREKRASSIQSSYSKLYHRVGNKRIRTFEFKSKDPSSDGSGKSHTQRIQIPDFREISRKHKGTTLKERIKLATEAGDVKVHCTCEDFKYKGYEWMADAGDYGIIKQSIAPNERNPKLEGSVCKHLHSILENIDSYYSDISTDLRKFLKKGI